MNPDQGTELRSGRVINSSSETSPTDPDMAQANSNDSDTNDNSDISSQLSEIKESYERRINEFHQEFSQLKDLMMGIVSKNNNESQPSSSKGPSKPTQQQGFDNALYHSPSGSTTRMWSFLHYESFGNEIGRLRVSATFFHFFKFFHQKFLERLKK